MSGGGSDMFNQSSRFNRDRPQDNRGETNAVRCAKERMSSAALSIFCVDGAGVDTPGFSWMLAVVVAVVEMVGKGTL